MKVIFIQNVAKQGRIGEVKNVADGFALNVLIPKKQAVIATPQALKKLEENKMIKEFTAKTDEKLFQKVLQDLEEITKNSPAGALEITGHKADKDGNLFSKVKESDIVEAIEKVLGVKLNPKQIILPKETIKKVGSYEIELKNEKVRGKLEILIK